ncbi:MAG: hypothetical protein PHS82_15290 [Lachnospiraceae bacterium]|nr:hypothetical protein [Lachnospiraceae bacterium]
MDQKKMKAQLILAWVSVLAVLAGITAVTFAWFSFRASTNVEPMSSTISQGDASLLISNASTGPFETQCALNFDANPDTLDPVSTADLTSFYQTAGQNRDGISISYQDITDQRDDHVLSGTVYLQSTGGTNQVYFLPSAFNLGADAQTMAALRLGMRITIDGQTTMYVFRLDGLMSGDPESTQTVPTAGTVVSAVDASGNADYTADPSEQITDYMAVENGAEDAAPQAGTNVLCTLGSEQIASVEYWIYLEGCDENCLKSVQSSDVPVQFGFAGIPGEVER